MPRKVPNVPSVPRDTKKEAKMGVLRDLVARLGEKKPITGANVPSVPSETASNSPLVPIAGANVPSVHSETASNSPLDGLDRDRLRINMRTLGRLLGMTPKELVTCGVIELEDYPQLAAMTPDVVRVLAQVSAERLGVCIKVA